MERVQLEGTETPSVFLATGARITVDLTPYIRKLIRGGYVRIVSAPAPKTVIEAMAEVEKTVADAPRAERIERDEPEVEIFDPANPQIAPPPRSASRTAWAAWLTLNRLEVPESAPRNELIALWDAHELAAEGSNERG